VPAARAEEFALKVLVALPPCRAMQNKVMVGS